MDPSDFEGRHFNFNRIAAGSPLRVLVRIQLLVVSYQLSKNQKQPLWFEVHDAVLHHEVDLLQLLHVGDGISGHGDDVSVFARLD